MLYVFYMCIMLYAFYMCIMNEWKYFGNSTYFSSMSSFSCYEVGESMWHLSALTPSPPRSPPPVVYYTDRSKAVVLVLVLLFVALWFILRGDLFYVLPCVTLFLCFLVLLALRLPRLGKRELILVHFVRLLDLLLFGVVCFLFLLVSGKGCGL